MDPFLYLVRYLLIFVSIPALFTCGNPISTARICSTPQITDTIGKIKFHFDSLVIYKWGIKESGGKLSHSFIWNDSSYLVTSTCSTLFILNIHDTSMVREIPLPDGVNFCVDYAGLYFDNPEKFYMVMHSKDILLYDHGKWTNHSYAEEYLKKDALVIPQKIKADELFVENDSLFYIRVVRDAELEGTFSKFKTNYPITAAINPSRQQATYLGVGYPGHLELGEYAFLRAMYHNFYNGRILYSFEAIPEIWEYNLQDSSLIKHVVPSKYQTEKIKPISKKGLYDMDAQWQHMMRNGWYDKFFLYDPYRKLYYRFFNLPLPEKNSDGYFNAYEDTRISLMVLDEKFNVIAEQLLPRKCYFIFYAAVAREGIYINHGPVKNPQKNGFPLLKISVTEN